MPTFRRTPVEMAASNTTYRSGTIVVSGGANVTVGTNAQTITIAAQSQSVQTQNLHNVTIGGNVTLTAFANKG